jgi:hypothetical protein
MFAARKGLRSQGTPASHEQGRLVVGSGRAGNGPNPSQEDRTPVLRTSHGEAPRGTFVRAASGYPQV